ncbi:G2/M phase-specific E3 ubiquitin-protein ligase-like [Rhopilema esculentum]|uniref:G2/M phase-specific E3 ubiquitin-protein ligase-like n=1 Tax=Rhopilema esculentum TaxID=499914 RepID=UPI0031D4FF16
MRPLTKPPQQVYLNTVQHLMTDIYKVEEKDSITCLEELCPNKSSDDVMAALETANGNINEAAQYLLGEQPEQIFSTDHMEFSPFSTADSAFFETGQENLLAVENRESIVVHSSWNSSTYVWKKQRLRLFEGDPNKLIPRRGIGSKGIQFEIAGALIAHSVLQGGPGFPYLAEWFVDLLFEDETSNTVCLISKDDIPKNAMTEKLFNFVEKLDSSINQQAIEEILDNDPQKEAFWEIINASEWSSTEAITMQNKALLIQELITNELMQKRMYQVISFRKGLAVLNFFPILKKHKDQAKTLLCYQASVITAEQFKSLLLPKGDQTHAEKQAYTWFLDNIQESEGVKDDTFPEGKLNTILKFVTGLWTVPPTRESLQISVEFLEDDDTEIYPKATACAAILRLPTVHSSRNGFFTRMDQGLSFGHAGFAEL